MGRGKVTPDETIELIKATYAMNGNARETSRTLSVPEATVRKHITTDIKDEFTQIRAEKRVDIIAKITEAQIVLIDAIVARAKKGEDPTRDLATAFGIVTDKHQLLTGEATERHEHLDTTDARDTIARRIDELAERRRARQADSQPLREASR